MSPPMETFQVKRLLTEVVARITVAINHLLNLKLKMILLALSTNKLSLNKNWKVQRQTLQPATILTCMMPSPSLMYQTLDGLMPATLNKV